MNPNGTARHLRQSDASTITTALQPQIPGGLGRYRTAAFFGFTLVSAYLFFFVGVLVRTPYDTWAAFVLAPILGFAGMAILHRSLPRVEEDLWIRKAITLGLWAKIFGGFARFYTNELILGHGDAKNYYRVGSMIADEFRQLNFGGPAFQEFVPNLTGTRFIRLLTAIPYVVTGSTHLGGYIIFSFFSFWGLYLFYRAFCIAVPDGLRRRYAILVFFLPSVIFWPSSIGKEAWMTTMLGLGSYGLARLLTQQRFAYLAVLAAIAGMGLVRPHVAAIFGVAMAAAFVLRRSAGRGGTTRKIIGLVVLAAVAGILMNQLQTFFGVESVLDAQEVFDETTRRSGQGGSQYTPVQPTSPTALPWAIVTVLFRPFAFEAGSAAGLVTAFEGTVLMMLFIWNIPRLAGLPGSMIRRPYVGYAVIYAVIFAFAFSAVSNFGILARQRTQLIPIIVIVLAIPTTPSLRIRRDLEQFQNRPDGPRAGRSRPGAMPAAMYSHPDRHHAVGPRAAVRPAGSRRRRQS